MYDNGYLVIYTMDNYIVIFNILFINHHN